MTSQQATDLVLRILGVAECPKETKVELKSFLELLIGAKPAPPVKSKVVDTPNELKPEENTINLADAFHFDFPKEFNLQVEGQEGTKKMKIFPDGLSETPAEPTEA